MNKTQFLLICQLTDKLLTLEKVKTERVAISFLHVIRAHPVFLSKYEFLFKNINSKFFFIQMTFSYVFNIWIQLLKSLYSSRILSNSLSLKKPTFIFVSHLINESHINEEYDFYFGDLPSKLDSNNCFSIICMINHTSLSYDLLLKEKEKSNTNKIILSNRLNFIEEIKMLNSCFKESMTLRREAKGCSDPILKQIILKASTEVLSQSTFQNLRIGYQIRELVKKYQPKGIITTFEGHAWERIVFSEAKKSYQNIRCFGYQHAAIFKNQHAIKRPLSSKFNPDSILTSGMLGFEQLVKNSSYKNVSIEILGSHKNVFPNTKANNEKENICLVIPEGIESECLILFEFSLLCALKYPELKFIWRVHPILKIEKILMNVFPYRELPKNIYLSKSLLEDDLYNAKWALYRGTTAIVQAVVYGVFPIYFDTNDFNIDPLFSIKDKIFNIKNEREFYKLVFNHVDMEYLNISLLELKRKINDFYTPINLNVLILPNS